MRLQWFWGGCIWLAAVGCSTRSGFQPTAAKGTTPAVASTAEPSQEFGPTDSGLLYPAATMRQLHYIVDSLHLRFRRCEITATYRSPEQAKAQYFHLTGKQASQACADLKRGLKLESLRKKYPKSVTTTDVLVVRDQDEDENGKPVNRLYIIDPGDNDFVASVPVCQPEGVVVSRWLTTFHEKTDYGEAKVIGLWLSEPLHAPPLASGYARMVQYADCMVDTSAEIFRTESRRGRRYDDASSAAVTTAIEFVHRRTQYPPQPADLYEDTVGYQAYYAAMHEWDSLRIKRLAQLSVGERAQLRTLLQAAADSAIRSGGSSEELEEYVTEYLSPATALALKRSRHVIGGCSMDDSPRRHAVSIAKLSAQTLHWETFLRAHLDILNDRFDRVSDGNYAWARRQTYLRELEELDFDVLELLVGTTLRLENAGRHHYYGSTRRMGRALAESREPKAVEQRLRTMIADPALDDFNRVQLFFLYCHLAANRTSDRALAKTQMEEAGRQLPPYLAAQVSFRD